MMQEINAAYHLALAGRDGEETHDNEGKAHTYRYNAEREESILKQVYVLLKSCPAGVSVDLIGFWIWITGTLREDRATQAALKLAGCRWHSVRSCWYWRPAELRHWGRQNRGSLEDLADKYGVRSFAARGETALAVA